eukprot:2567740-Rhodomonas_salina.1
MQSQSQGQIASRCFQASFADCIALLPGFELAPSQRRANAAYRSTLTSNARPAPLLNLMVLGPGGAEAGRLWAELLQAGLVCPFPPVTPPHACATLYPDLTC